MRDFRGDFWLGASFCVLALLLLFVIIPAAVTVPRSVRAAVMSPDLWPRIIAVFIFTMAALLAIRATLAPRRGRGPADGEPLLDTAESRGAWPWPRLGLGMLLLVGYYWLIVFLGLVAGSMVALFAAGVFGTRPANPLLIAVAAALPLLLYAFFYKVAGIPIPGGVLVDFP